jgi:hypothetical protein
VFRVAPKLLEAVMGKEKAREAIRSMFNEDGNDFMTVGPKAEAYDSANQEAAVEALEHLLEYAKTHKYLRLGQLLINAGVAEDSNPYWNASSQGLLNKVKKFCGKDEA